MILDHNGEELKYIPPVKVKTQALTTKDKIRLGVSAGLCILGMGMIGGYTWGSHDAIFKYKSTANEILEHERESYYADSGESLIFRHNYPMCANKPLSTMNGYDNSPHCYDL